ncbi:MAG: hypothetical protein ACLPX5_01240 [Dissulfurispiraceae bacterium]
MPCGPRKAKILLASGEAPVETRTPFVIRCATTLSVIKTMRFLPDLKDGVPTAQG